MFTNKHKNQTYVYVPSKYSDNNRAYKIECTYTNHDHTAEVPSSNFDHSYFDHSIVKCFLKL